MRAPDALPDDVYTALLVAAYELLVRGTPPRAAVHSWVELVKARRPALSGLVNAVLRRVEAPTVVDEATRHALPAWLWRTLVEALGEAPAAMAAAGMLEPEPLWLSTYGDGPEDVRARLEREGFEVAPGPLPGSLAVRPPAALASTAAFRDGLVQPQNPSSSVAATLLAPATGERVLDLASGNGVKTAQLAAAGARVTSVELDPRRVAAAKANLYRLGLRAEHRTLDLFAPTELEPAAAVLLDAPCSGTGTLRGHPEIKLRLHAEDLRALAGNQDRMLDAAAALVAPGGRLVYAVCALTAMEGEERVAALLERHPGLRRSAWPEGPWSDLPAVPTPNGRYLLPVAGLDGFYLSRLERPGARTPSPP